MAGVGRVDGCGNSDLDLVVVISDFVRLDFMITGSVPIIMALMNGGGNTRFMLAKEH